MRTFKFGDVRITNVVERTGPVRTAQVMFADATDDSVARALGRLPDFTYDVATGMLVIAYQSYVVQTPSCTILIDSCVGDHPEYADVLQYDKQPWLDGLASLGLGFDDIDYVFCTHMHIDHVGWNTRLLDGRIVPTFPNAKYVFSRREYDAWKREKDGPAVGKSFALCIDPIVDAGQAMLVEDNFVLSDQIWLVPTPGHSPGHVSVALQAGKQQILFAGDVLHHAIQCIEPDWTTAFCFDAEQTIRTRRNLFSRHEKSDTLIFPAHFPQPGCGHIRADRDHWRFDFVDDVS